MIGATNYNWESALLLLYMDFEDFEKYLVVSFLSSS